MIENETVRRIEIWTPNPRLEENPDVIGACVELFAMRMEIILSAHQ